MPFAYRGLLVKRRPCLSVALLVWCVVFLGAPAGGSEKPSLKPGPEIAVKNRATAGLRASIDPATGKHREPTSEESRALSRPARAVVSPKDLVAVRHSNGMTSVDLRDAFLMDLVARRNADGTVSIDCAPPRRQSTPHAASSLEER